MKRIAVFPGSFDPVTLGHINIIERAQPMFDKIIIAIGQNSAKTGHFTLEQRIQWLSAIYLHTPSVEIHAFQGLTVDFCRQQNAQFILRGIRSAADYEYEKVIAQTNKQMVPEVETVFLLTDPRYAHISSTIVKEVLKHGGDIGGMVPAIVTG